MVSSVRLTRIQPRSARANIHIKSNGDFNAGNGVTGGSGTATDPYVLDALSFTGTGGAAAAIVIEGTTAHAKVSRGSHTCY